MYCMPYLISGNVVFLTGTCFYRSKLFERACISSGKLQWKFPYDNIYCNKVHKTRFTQKAKVSLHNRWTLLVIIVPRHTHTHTHTNRTGKHTAYIYSDGIDLQQAQKPQQKYQEKIRRLHTPADIARNRRELTCAHMSVLHVTRYILTSGHTHTASHKILLFIPTEYSKSTEESKHTPAP